MDVRVSGIVGDVRQQMEDSDEPRMVLIIIKHRSQMGEDDFQLLF